MGLRRSGWLPPGSASRRECSCRYWGVDPVWIYVRACRMACHHLPSWARFAERLRLEGDWGLALRARPPDADREALGSVSPNFPPSELDPLAGRQLEALGDRLARPISAFPSPARIRGPRSGCGPPPWRYVPARLHQRSHQRNRVDSSDLVRLMRQECQERAAQRHCRNWRRRNRHFP